MSTLPIAPLRFHRLAALEPLSLDDVDRTASLQTRRERKYVLLESELDSMLDDLRHRVGALEIGGQRLFGYESVYFDDAHHTSYLAAARGRPTRSKVRVRSYLDTRTSMLEIKRRGSRGETVKRRQDHCFDDRRMLDAHARRFVDDQLGPISASLRPALTTRYDRFTVADRDEPARMTIDVDLRCTDPHGRTAGIGNHLVVETKSSGPPCFFDRWLWRHGVRPTKISKFGAGSAALDASLPSNKWHRTLTKHWGCNAS